LVDAQFVSTTPLLAQSVMLEVDVAVDVAAVVALVTAADAVAVEVDAVGAVASATVVDAEEHAAAVVAAPTVAALATSPARSRPSKPKIAAQDGRYFDTLACGSLALWVVRS
jgi:hypothetical protein